MEGKVSPEEGQRMVDEMHDELFERIKERLPLSDIPRVQAAYEMAAKAHKQSRLYKIISC